MERSPAHATISVGYADRFSMDAVRWAANEAVLRGADLSLIGCYHVPIHSGAWTGLTMLADIDRAEIEMRVELGRVAAGLEACFPTLDVHVSTAAGPASTGLGAASEHAAMLVVGSHRHEGRRELWFAHTARRLADHGSCPIVVVRQPNQPGYIRRLVVGVDGWEHARAALSWAAAEADVRGVEVVALHAWNYPYTGMGMHTDVAHDLTQVDAACLLDHAVEHTRARCGAPVSAQLVEGGPTASILGAIRDGDLVVLGSRGRNALHTAIFGSTVNSLLETSPVSLVIVREQMA